MASWRSICDALSQGAGADGKCTIASVNVAQQLHNGREVRLSQRLHRLLDDTGPGDFDNVLNPSQIPYSEVDILDPPAVLAMPPGDELDNLDNAEEAPAPDNLVSAAEDLQQALVALSPLFATSLPPPKASCALIKQPSRETDLAEVFAALSSQNTGASNTFADQLSSLVGSTCQWCEKNLLAAIEERFPPADQRVLGLCP